MKKISDKLSHGNKKLLNNLAPSYLDFVNKKQKTATNMAITQNSKTVEIYKAPGIESAYYFRKSLRIRFLSHESQAYVVSWGVSHSELFVKLDKKTLKISSFLPLS